MPVGDRHQLLGPIGADPDDHQGAQAVLVEADVEVDPVGPHVHVVDLGQAAPGEPVPPRPATGVVSRVITDADSPAADPKNSSSAGAKSFELIPCRYINGSTSATFGRLAGPRRDDRAAEPAPLPGRLVDPAVIHPRRHHLDRPGAGHDLAGLGVPVADHQPPAVLVDLVDQARHVRVDLGLQRRGQHPPGALTDDLIQRRTQLRARLLVSYYSQHRRSFLAGAATPTVLVCSVRKVRRALATDGASTSSGYNSQSPGFHPGQSAGSNPVSGSHAPVDEMVKVVTLSR